MSESSTSFTRHPTALLASTYLNGGAEETDGLIRSGSYLGRLVELLSFGDRMIGFRNNIEAVVEAGCTEGIEGSGGGEGIEVLGGGEGIEGLGSGDGAEADSSNHPSTSVSKSTFPLPNVASRLFVTSLARAVWRALGVPGSRSAPNASAASASSGTQGSKIETWASLLFDGLPFRACQRDSSVSAFSRIFLIALRR